MCEGSRIKLTYINKKPTTGNTEFRSIMVKNGNERILNKKITAPIVFPNFEKKFQEIKSHFMSRF